MLRTIKDEGGLGFITCNKFYPTGAGSSKSYGLPKINEKDTP